MTAHLLLVTIGPVQDFIAQARRTRDLWHGSHLISELSRTVARTLTEDGARLLVPALDASDDELRPCWTPVRPETERPPEAVANKILALIDDGGDPEELARHARAAVMSGLRDHAETVWQRFEPLLRPEARSDVRLVWNEQLDDALEFSAGWAALDRPFESVRRELDNAIAARKRLRDFRPWTQSRAGARKSSLDGARESVLPFVRGEQLQRAFGLGENEELDAIGLVKRAGAEPEQFIPLINVALAPWLAWAAREHAVALDDCRKACAALGVQVIKSPQLADDFRYEASILLPARWSALESEQSYVGDERWMVAREAVLALRRATRASDDEPYVACIVADGDRMGDVIDRIVDPEQLRRLSRELSAFAAQARNIVRRHQGSLVYAGGDDVLAFVPVSRAMACAEALRRSFGRIVGGACAALGIAGERQPLPTLSVGIGVGHYMESMGELLQLGREAELIAKGASLPLQEQRNAVAIIVDKRSGGRRTWRRQWDESLVDDVGRDIELTSILSIGKIHEIQATVRRLPLAAEPDDEFATLLELEVNRSLRRNEGTPLDIESVYLKLPDSDYAARRIAVQAWIDRLLIARELGRSDIVRTSENAHGQS